MPKITEVINSLNDENISSEARESLLAEANALAKQNSQLYARAKRAEGFELDKATNKWVKKEIKSDPATPVEKTGTSGKLDYAQKAFLSANGVKIGKEMELAERMIRETGKEIEELLESKYFQSELKDLRDDITSKAALPNGSGRSAVTSLKNTPEYWYDKGELPPPDQVDLRRKVVNLRYQREKGVNPFQKK